MKILFLSTRLPHLRSFSGHGLVFQRIRRLAERGHTIGAAVFSEPGCDEHADELRPFVDALEIVEHPWRVGARGTLTDAVRPRPRPCSMYASADMARRVGELVERRRYDVALAEFSVMGQFLDRNVFLPAVRRVISVHHCYTIMNRKALRIRGWRPRTVREWFALKGLQRFEFSVYRAVDRVLALTSELKFGLLQYAPDLRTAVVPIGVDTEYFQPGDPAAREKAILFTGHFNDEPNRDAVARFIIGVWPALRRADPDLRFYVVGPGPTPEMREFSRRDPRIVVTGEVADVRPYLARAQVFVCPMRMGTGVRVKVLEAMAAGVPVVATTAGAEGVPFQIGDTGFLADQPAIMAQYINLLLTDPDLRERISRRARAMMVERFAWDHGIGLLEQVLTEVVTKG